MSNSALIALLTSHNIYLQRLNTGAVNSMLEAFDKASQPKLARLEKMLGNLTKDELTALSGGVYRTERLKRINTFFVEWQEEIEAELKGVFKASAEELAGYEANFVKKADLQSNPPAITTTAANMYAAVAALPYAGGHTIQHIFPSIGEKLRTRLNMVISDGIAAGLSNSQIVRQIKGTKKNSYRDGMLNEIRRHIDTEVRTARAHISNSVYEQTWLELGYKYVKVIATLDGRTTMGCAALDGKVYKIGTDFRKPPYHYNCRTVLVGCDKDGNIAGYRPFVADNRPVKDIPKDQREGKIGQVPANTTYASWFAKQPVWLQKDILGATRFKLFKEGGMKLDKFVDYNHKLITLEKLKEIDNNLFNELQINLPNRGQR